MNPKTILQTTFVENKISRLTMIKHGVNWNVYHRSSVNDAHKKILSIPLKVMVQRTIEISSLFKIDLNV